jgi:hypothetical protein
MGISVGAPRVTRVDRAALSIPSAAGHARRGMARPQASFRALDLGESTGIGSLTRSMKWFVAVAYGPPVEGFKLVQTQRVGRNLLSSASQP